MFRGTLCHLFRVNISVLPKMLFSKQPPEGYRVVVSQNDVDDTLRFIGNSFINEEPVTKSLEIEDKSDLLRFLKTTITDSTAVKMIENSTGETVGLALCHIGSPESSEEIRSFAECSVCDYKTKRLMNFLAALPDSPNLFDCFKVQKIWEIFILSTAPSVRGKGFSKLLINEARRQGVKEGLSIAQMNCTSHFSARLATSMKFTTCSPRHVLTYRDKKGTPWLPKAPPPPHGYVVISYDFLT